MQHDVATVRLAADVADLALSRGVRVGVAESLTGGQLSAVLAAARDASEWFVGGLVAYGADVKRALLRVGPGSVLSRECALEMACGGRELLDVDVLVAVTGVGGPTPEEGHPPGSVWFAVSGGDGQPERTDERVLPGDPSEVVAGAVHHALELLREMVRDRP